MINLQRRFITLTAFLLIISPLFGCSQQGIKVKTVQNPEIPAAELINIPLTADFISFTFHAWLDNTRALVTRNSQDPKSLEAINEWFIYDTQTHRYWSVNLPDSDQEVVFSALLSDGRLLFESQKDYFDERNDSYQINSVWLYDINAQTAARITPVEGRTTSVQGEKVFPNDLSSHYYIVDKNDVTIFYPDPNLSGFSQSPDGKYLAYTDDQGLYVADSDFQNSKLILPAAIGSDPSGIDSEGPKVPYWAGNDKIVYYWVGYEWLVGSGIINRDGSNDFRPDFLKGRYLVSTENEHLFLVYSSPDSTPFLGIYNLKENIIEDLSEEFGLNYVQSIIVAPGGRKILAVGAEQEDSTIQSTLIELKKDYSGIKRKVKFSGSYFYSPAGTFSLFSADSSRIMIQAPYENQEYMLYSIKTDELI